MRKMSKAAKAEAYDALERELQVYRLATHFAFNGLPDAVEHVADPRGAGKDWLEFRLYGALRADGGTLVTLSGAPGCTTSVTAARFEDWLQRVHVDACYGVGIGTEIAIAAERLTLARHRLYEAEVK